MNETMVRISRTEVAKKTGMDVSMVSRFLNGRRVPNAHQLKKMAEALGMSLDELYQMLYEEGAVNGSKI